METKKSEIVIEELGLSFGYECYHNGFWPGSVNSQTVHFWVGTVLVKQGDVIQPSEDLILPSEGIQEQENIQKSLTGHAVIVDDSLANITEAVGNIPVIDSGKVIQTPLYKWLIDELKAGTIIYVVWPFKDGKFVSREMMGVEAGKYARMQIGKPYNWDFPDRFTEEKFYCSQLCWRAWYNQGCRLDRDGKGIIKPNDLLKEENEARTVGRIWLVK